MKFRFASNQHDAFAQVMDNIANPILRRTIKIQYKNDFILVSVQIPKDDSALYDLICSQLWPEALPERLIVRCQKQIFYRSINIIGNLICGDNIWRPRQTYEAVINDDSQQVAINHQFTSHPLFNKNFLDFGCGDGSCVTIAKDIARTAIGYDCVKNDCWRLEKLDCTDDLNIVKARGPYDIILLHDVLDHTPDPDKILETVYQLLSEDGIVFVRNHPWTSIHGGHLYYSINKAFVHWFLPNLQSDLDKPEVLIDPHIEYQQLFKKHGFIITNNYAQAANNELIIDPDVIQYLLARPHGGKTFNSNQLSRSTRMQYIDYELIKDKTSGTKEAFMKEELQRIWKLCRPKYDLGITSLSQNHKGRVYQKDGEYFREFSPPYDKFMSTNVYKRNAGILWPRATKIDQGLYQIETIKHIVYWVELGNFNKLRFSKFLCSLILLLMKEKIALESHLWNIVIVNGNPTHIDLGDFSVDSPDHLIEHYALNTVISNMRIVEEPHCPIVVSSWLNDHNFWCEYLTDNRIDLSTRLYKFIKDAKHIPQDNAWGSYQQAMSKFNQLLDFINSHQIKSVVDLGCNHCGLRDELSDQIHYIGIDINDFYKKIKNGFVCQFDILNPPFVNAHKPIPVAQRIKSDIVVAAGLIHHLYLSCRDIKIVLDTILSYTDRYVAIEYVGANDEHVQSLNVLDGWFELEHITERLTDTVITDSNRPHRKWVIGTIKQES